MVLTQFRNQILSFSNLNHVLDLVYFFEQKRKKQPRYQIYNCLVPFYLFKKEEITKSEGKLSFSALIQVKFFQGLKLFSITTACSKFLIFNCYKKDNKFYDIFLETFLSKVLAFS